MDTAKILQKIGLSEHESIIYMALLERGSMNISDLCRFTHIHRPSVYKAIESLKARNIISETPRGKRVLFTAEPPSALTGEIGALSMALAEALPKLTGMYERQGARPIIRFFEGKAGLTAVFDDVVNSLGRGEVFYRYSSRNYLYTDGDKYLSKQYRTIRDQKHLERLVITNQQASLGKPPRLERETKIIPQGFDPFDYNITQVIYGNKTALIDYNTETALVIENEKMALFFMKLFKLLYSKL
jgi:sugar-specific transcriptional regulator TrmB